MASVYWRNGIAWGKVQRGGRPQRRSLNTKDPATAELRLNAWVKELDAQRHGVGLGDHTVREAADRFVDEHMPNLKPGAIERYATSLTWLLPHFGDMPLAKVTRKDLYAFEQARRKMRSRMGGTVSPVTIKRDLACLSSIFSFAEEALEWCSANPVKPFLRGRRRAGMIVESDGRTRYLDHQEERSLIRHASTEIRDAIIFAIETGLRAEEQWSLLRTDIDFARRRLTVREEVAKSGRARTIPLSAQAFEIAEKLRPNNRTEYLFGRAVKDEHGNKTGYGPVEHTWAWRQLQAAAAAARIEDLQWHDLRRTCGCRLLQDKDLDMTRVSKWLGHSSVKVTEKSYAFLYVDDLEKALTKQLRA